MENLIIFIVLVALGYFAGSYAEKKHYKSIIAREKQYLSLPVVNFKTLYNTENKKIKQAYLVHGSAVISIDYFKRLFSILKNIFGGSISTYESLVDRARREAVLRMKEQAFGKAEIILNLRIETASISSNANNKNNVGSIEAYAYGTAIEFEC